jgi:hypothetical protein
MEMARARAPVAVPQFARTMNEPLPEELRGLAGGGPPPDALKAVAETAERPQAKSPPPAPKSLLPETIAVERRPAANASIDTVRLVGPTGTFETTLGTCIVGRGSEAAIRINSKEMSRRHAQLVVRPTEITVEDLKSANGTKVNGTAVTVPTKVSDGDTISFAGFKFRVEIVRFEREG